MDPQQVAAQLIRQDAIGMGFNGLQEEMLRCQGIHERRRKYEAWR